MKEALKSFAYKLHPLEFESMCAFSFGDLIEEAYKHASYDEVLSEEIREKRENILSVTGIENAVIKALQNDGMHIDKEAGQVLILNMERIKDKVASKMWMNDNVIPIIRDDIIRVASEMKAGVQKEAASERDASFKPGDEYITIKKICETCKHSEDRRDQGGKVWCKLWNTPIENVAQVKSQEKFDNHCVPTKYLTQGQPDSGTNQWGNETPRNPTGPGEEKLDK